MSYLGYPPNFGTFITQTEAQNLVNGSTEFVATGTIAKGDIVSLRSDGTVEKVAYNNSTTNAASWIGIARENISNAATGRVNTIGGVAEGLSSLTVNTDYFVNYDGTLTATENVGPVTGTYGKIGRALSSTQLLITMD